jgi:mitotic spindle assembly checkpoint protein MAD1
MEMASLRDKVQSLSFELSTLRNERELEKIRHEDTVRELEQKIKAEGKRADVSF